MDNPRNRPGILNRRHPPSTAASPERSDFQGDQEVGEVLIGKDNLSDFLSSPERNDLQEDREYREVLTPKIFLPDLLTSLCNFLLYCFAFLSSVSSVPSVVNFPFGV